MLLLLDYEMSLFWSTLTFPGMQRKPDGNDWLSAEEITFKGHGCWLKAHNMDMFACGFMCVTACTCVPLVFHKYHADIEGKLFLNVIQRHFPTFLSILCVWPRPSNPSPAPSDSTTHSLPPAPPPISVLTPLSPLSHPQTPMPTYTHSHSNSSKSQWIFSLQQPSRMNGCPDIHMHSFWPNPPTNWCMWQTRCKQAAHTHYVDIQSNVYEGKQGRLQAISWSQRCLCLSLFS